jgi:hypothetical protein
MINKKQELVSRLLPDQDPHNGKPGPHTARRWRYLENLKTKSLALLSCAVYSARTALMVLLTLSEALPPDLIGAVISIIIDDKKKR